VITLILGSSSPRRQQLLSLCGLLFTVARPDIDESVLAAEAPAAYVARLSHAKALAIEPATRPALILTADTTVVIDDEIIGKPSDAAEARLMLDRLRGRPHSVYTGVSLRDTRTEQIITEVVASQVHMRPYDAAAIEAYIATGSPFDKAGGYAVQDSVFKPVERLSGCLPSVMGLPLCTVRDLLAAAGLAMPQPPLCGQQNLPCIVNL
jgi:septum formation protein